MTRCLKGILILYTIIYYFFISTHCFRRYSSINLLHISELNVTLQQEIKRRQIWRSHRLFHGTSSSNRPIRKSVVKILSNRQNVIWRSFIALKYQLVFKIIFSFPTNPSTSFRSNFLVRKKDQQYGAKNSGPHIKFPPSIKNRSVFVSFSSAHPI